MKLLKSNGINIDIRDKQWLLTLRFRDVNDKSTVPKDEYSWMPQWQTVRDLMLSAVVVEAINSKYPGEETTKFREALKDIDNTVVTIVNMVMGQLGIED